MIQVHRPSKPILGSTMGAGLGDVFSAIGDMLDKADQEPRLEGGHTTGPPRKPGLGQRIRDRVADFEDTFEQKVIDPIKNAWDDSPLGRMVDTFPDQDDWLRTKALMR